MFSFFNWIRLSSFVPEASLAQRIAVQVRRRIPQGFGNTASIEFAGEQLPPGDERLHFAYIGTTGSGKSTSLQLLMQQALPSIGFGLARRAVIYDAKRDLLGILANMNPQVPVTIFNPFDQRCVAWDLSEDVTDPATAHQIASIFIPQNEKLAQPFFEDTARSVVAGVLNAFSALTQKYGVKWDLRDVILGCSHRFARRVLALSNQNHDIIHSLLKGREDTAKDVFATLSTKLSPFRPIAALWSQAEKTLSLKAWSETESILVLGSNPAKSEAIGTINRVIFSRLVDLVSDFPDQRNHHSDPRRTWFFLDELAQMGTLPKLRDLFGFGRSKGVCVALGFQDIEGLYPIYGRDTVHSLLGNASHKAFFRLESNVTADWASALFGNKRVYVDTTSATESHSSTGYGGSSGTAQSFHEISEIMPSEFMGISPASAEAGIHGYYLLPAAMKSHRSNPFDGRTLVTPHPDVQNFDPAPAEKQYLKEWNEADLQRLHLHGAAPCAASMPSSASKLQKTKRAGRLPRD